MNLKYLRFKRSDNELCMGHSHPLSIRPCIHSKCIALNFVSACCCCCVRSFSCIVLRPSPDIPFLSKKEQKKSKNHGRIRIRSIDRLHMCMVSVSSTPTQNTRRHLPNKTICFHKKHSTMCSS